MRFAMFPVQDQGEMNQGIARKMASTADAAERRPYHLAESLQGPALIK